MKNIESSLSSPTKIGILQVTKRMGRDVCSFGRKFGNGIGIAGRTIGREFCSIDFNTYTTNVAMFPLKIGAKVIQGAFDGFVNGVRNFYISPTFIRKELEGDYSSEKSFFETIYGLTGVLSWGATFLSQAVVYYRLSDSSGPQKYSCLFPVATNIASGIYEWGRETKRKLERETHESSEKQPPVSDKDIPF